MYVNQICLKQILALVSKSMFQLNKIRAHIKMLAFEQTKLEMYLAEAKRDNPDNVKRISDIERSLNRVTKNIQAFETKLARFEVAPARPVSRPAIGDDDPSKPLIG
jgi:septal ring factor EnvC (AmiA/AmiB activator)